MGQIYDISRILIAQGTSIKEGYIAALDRHNSKLVPITFSRPSIATIVNKNGYITTVGNNIPRWDWSEGLSCPTLLIESEATNYSPYSDYFQALSGNWTGNNIVVTNYAGISPDKKNNANLITDSGANTDGTSTLRYAVISGAIPTNNTYTISIFGKKGTSNWLAIQTLSFTSPSDSITYFNLDTGELGTTSSGHTNPGMIDYGNGWYRCYFSISFGNDVIGDIRYYIADSDNDVVINRNGTNNLYLWGHQIEKSSSLSSYIPTTDLPVTRNRDIINKTNLGDYIDDTGGTFILEAMVFDKTIDNEISINGGDSNNGIRIRFGSNGIVSTLILKDGSTIVNLIGNAYLENIYYRIVVRYDRNDFNLNVDGRVLDIDIDGSTFDLGDLNTLSFDADSQGSNPFYGRVKLLSVLDTSLTDEETRPFAIYDSFIDMASSKNYTQL